jgi:hypothetical protein
MIFVIIDLMFGGFQQGIILQFKKLMKLERNKLSFVNFGIWFLLSDDDFA